MSSIAKIGKNIVSCQNWQFTKSTLQVLKKYVLLCLVPVLLCLVCLVETASSFYSRQKYYPEITCKLAESVRAVALFWSADKSLAKQMASNKYNRPGCEKLLRQTSPAYYLHKSAHWLHLGLPKQAWHFDLLASANTDWVTAVMGAVALNVLL